MPINVILSALNYHIIILILGHYTINCLLKWQFYVVKLQSLWLSIADRSNVFAHLEWCLYPSDVILALTGPVMLDVMVYQYHKAGYDSVITGHRQTPYYDSACTSDIISSINIWVSTYLSACTLNYCYLSTCEALYHKHTNTLPYHAVTYMYWSGPVVVLWILWQSFGFTDTLHSRHSGNSLPPVAIG